MTDDMNRYRKYCNNNNDDAPTSYLLTSSDELRLGKIIYVSAATIKSSIRDY